MGTRAARAFETSMVVIIALAILIGGRGLVVEVARLGPASALALAALGILQAFALVRNYSSGGPFARVRASRDVAFLAATVAAICFVVSPARWSIGACIAALEFGLVLELLARLTPPPPQIDEWKKDD